MRILLSSIGSRGDVQPILALAVELKKLGHEASLCVPPNFQEWVESFGIACIPIGPDLKKMTGGTMPVKPVTPTIAQRRQLAAGTVHAQFQVVGEAARTTDLIVGAGALQVAARSIAQALGIPYIFAAYSPAVLPSPDNPPPNFGPQRSQTLPGIVNRYLWVRDEQSFNDMFRAPLNDERANAGLAPVRSVRPYIYTDRPWLAADPTLGPASPRAGKHIVQTGAWLLSERAALPEDLEKFLADGAPPVYFGFGSMRTTEGTGSVFIQAARSLRLRSIISQGWAGIGTGDEGPDCISIGDVNHEKLFPRVAAIVHHGGAGTTTSAARAGTPQVLVPHNYDQYYWAHRLRALGAGVSGPAREKLSVEAMVSALRACLQPDTAERARSLATRIELHGATIAAQRLVNEFA